MSLESTFIGGFSEHLPSYWRSLRHVDHAVLGISGVLYSRCMLFTALWPFTAGSKIYCQPR